MIFAALAIYGWALVLSRLAGPFDLCKRAREAWPRGPLSCPACVGWWLGALAGALYLGAQHWPSLAPLALLLGAPGAAAGVAWAGVHLAELARRGTERATQDAWLARLRAEKLRDHAAAYRASQAHPCPRCSEVIPAGGDSIHACK